MTTSLSGENVKEVKVTHNDLRMVSPYVRAIVEKDRALITTSQNPEDVPDVVSAIVPGCALFVGANQV